MSYIQSPQKIIWIKTWQAFPHVICLYADPHGRAVSSVLLRSVDFWDCGFESGLWHGCSSIVFVVWCVGSGSATGWSLVQSSSALCVSVCDLGTLAMRRRRPELFCCVTDKKLISISSLTVCSNFSQNVSFYFTFSVLKFPLHSFTPLWNSARPTRSDDFWHSFHPPSANFRREENPSEYLKNGFLPEAPKYLHCTKSNSEFIHKVSNFRSLNQGSTNRPRTTSRIITEWTVSQTCPVFALRVEMLWNSHLLVLRSLRK